VGEASLSIDSNRFASHASTATEGFSRPARIGKENMAKSVDPFAKALRPSEIGMRGEIGGKWSKLTAREVLDLKSNDDLVDQVQSKYQLSRPQAQSEVDAFAKGRRL
jgi:hypothetical protein